MSDKMNMKDPVHFLGGLIVVGFVVAVVIYIVLASGCGPWGA